MQTINRLLALVAASALLPVFSAIPSWAGSPVRPPAAAATRILLEAKEGGQPVGTQAVQQEEEQRISVELRDDSRIIGTATRPLLFKSTYPTIKLDPATFLTINLTDPSGAATVSFLNGDRLSGTVATDPVRLNTVLGHVAIPLKYVTRIYPYKALRSGLIAYWPFENNSQDSVGDHLLEGAALTYLPGVLGQAMSQSGNVQALKMTYTSDIDLNHDFTISFWAYREASIYDNDAVFDSGSVYIAKRDADGWASRMGVILTSTTDQRRIDLVDNSPMGQPPLKTWFHVVLFRKGNQVGMKVNNAGSATVDVTGMSLANKGTTYFGMQQWGYPWQGRLDEVGIWNRALSPEEINALYNGGKARQP